VRRCVWCPDVTDTNCPKDPETLCASPQTEKLVNRHGASGVPDDSEYELASLVNALGTTGPRIAPCANRPQNRWICRRRWRMIPIANRILLRFPVECGWSLMLWPRVLLSIAGPCAEPGPTQGPFGSPSQTFLFVLFSSKHLASRRNHASLHGHSGIAFLTPEVVHSRPLEAAWIS
jgi:hypothetical protein